MLKTTPNFALFDPVWKLREGVRSLYQLLQLYLRPNLRNTFDGHQLRGCWARCIDKKRKKERKFMGKAFPTNVGRPKPPNKEKHTHTTIWQWPGAYLLHCYYNSYYTENFSSTWHLCNRVVQLHLSYLRSSFMALVTNSLHSLFSDTLFFSRDFNLRTGTADSANSLNK